MVKFVGLYLYAGPAPSLLDERWLYIVKKWTFSDITLWALKALDWLLVGFERVYAALGNFATIVNLKDHFSCAVDVAFQVKKVLAKGGHLAIG